MHFCKRTLGGTHRRRISELRTLLSYLPIHGRHSAPRFPWCAEISWSRSYRFQPDRLPATVYHIWLFDACEARERMRDFMYLWHLIDSSEWSDGGHMDIRYGKSTRASLFVQWSRVSLANDRACKFRRVVRRFPIHCWHQWLTTSSTAYSNGVEHVRVPSILTKIELWAKVHTVFNLVTRKTMIRTRFFSKWTC